MSNVKYPTGTKPAMSNYSRQPIRKKQKSYRHHFNKFRAVHIITEGHRFDSKAELRYYNLLKFMHIKFRIHPKYTIIPHTNIKFGTQTLKIRKHSYTPDFVLYKHGHPYEVDDIKGISQVPSYDHLRMDLFTLKYHFPVTIVRFKRGNFIKKTRNL